MPFRLRSNRAVGTLTQSQAPVHVKMKPKDRIARLKNNPRLLFWGRALFETKILNAIITLFYVHRGLTLQEIFWLTIVWSVVALIAEVPTGYIADRIGRKNGILMGFGFFILSTILLIFSYGFPMMALTFILSALGHTFISGTDEALLYDTLKELKQEHTATMHNGRYFSARNLGKMIIPVIGAFIAKDLVDWQFNLLLVIDVALTVVGAFIIVRIEEPERFTSLAEKERRIFRDSILTLRNDPWLWRMALNKAFAFIAMFAFWRVYQIILSEHGVSAVWLGIFYFLFHGTAFLLRNSIHKLEEKYGTHLLANSILIIPAFAMGALFFVQNPIVIFVLSYIALAISTIREPLFMGLMNHRIASHHRATTLSNLSALRNLLDIPVYLIGGWLAMFYGAYAGVGIAIVLIVLALTVVRVRKADCVWP